jgi:hypothetical protein
MSPHNHKHNTSVFRPSSALGRSSTVHTTSTRPHSPSRLRPAYDTVLRNADRDIFGPSSNTTTTRHASMSTRAGNGADHSYQSGLERSLKRSNAVDHGGESGSKKSWGPTNSFGSANSRQKTMTPDRFHSPPTASRSWEYLPGTRIDLGSYAGGAYGGRSSHYGASSASGYDRRPSASSSVYSQSSASSSSTYRPGPDIDLSSASYGGGYSSGLGRSSTTHMSSSYSRNSGLSSRYY